MPYPVSTPTPFVLDVPFGYKRPMFIAILFLSFVLDISSFGLET
jgi:hypothetical protein